jgi:hypothetical protein
LQKNANWQKEDEILTPPKAVANKAAAKNQVLLASFELLEPSVFSGLCAPEICEHSYRESADR